LGDVSPWPIEERVRAAAESGFSGVGFYYDDLMSIQRRGELPRLREVLHSHAIQYGQFELGIADWWGTGPARNKADRMIQELIRAIESLALPDNHVKSLPELSGAMVSLEQYAAGFRQFAEACARIGAPVGLEFMPYSRIATAADALEIVDASGRENAGLIIDFWHVVRGATSLGSIRSIPEHKIVNVELNDADLMPVGTLIEDTIDRRRLCGEGAFDLPEFLDAVRGAGYRKVFGVEVISDEHRALPLECAARRAYETTAAQFAG
jgi:sugar phosphate isomerase/epimerase